MTISTSISSIENANPDKRQRSWAEIVSGVSSGLFLQSSVEISEVLDEVVSIDVEGDEGGSGHWKRTRGKQLKNIFRFFLKE